MAIIKYTLVNGQTPSGITDRGYWQHPRDETVIGIGSGVGTDISKDDLNTYVKSLKSITNIRHIEYDGSTPVELVNREPTDAEIESQIDAWCSARGIS